MLTRMHPHSSMTAYKLHCSVNLLLKTPHSNAHLPPTPSPTCRTLRTNTNDFNPHPLPKKPPHPLLLRHLQPHLFPLNPPLSSLSAPSASAAKVTKERSPIALPCTPGINNSKPSVRASTPLSSPARTTNQSVPSGSETKDAKRNTPISTSALAAVPPITELASALEHRKHHPLTPYIFEAWRCELTEAGLLPRFHSILPGLANGFVINFPPISCTQSPPNSSSVTTYAVDFSTIICKELDKGHYIGPFPLSLIEQTLGPFQSSPLSIIPKQGRPGKFRVIQNFSFPINPSPIFPNLSINQHIAAEDFPTTWGKFSVIYNLIARLPPGLEATTRDVAEAYRTIPLHPSQWPAGVVKISDMHGCIDTNLAFSSTPAAGAYGHMADACCEILRYHGIGPMDKWVDDHIFFRIRLEHLEDYNNNRLRWHQDILSNSPTHLWWMPLVPRTTPQQLHLGRI